MMAASVTHLALEISPRGDWKVQLFPEQSADFELRLRNTGPASVKALALFESFETPRVVVYNSKGAVLGRYTHMDQYQRQVGDPGVLEPPQPQYEDIAPGQASETSFDIWSFRAPLPPGSYSVEVEHQVQPGGDFLHSNRYSFEIVPAKVTSAALGYEMAMRAASVLAWLDAGHNSNGLEKLLVRISAGKGHGSLLTGAISHGEFPAGSKVSIAQVTRRAQESSQGWVAVVSGRQVIAIRHNGGYPYWRSEPAALDLDHCVLVPRFPSMFRQALFLAAGDAAHGPVLAGALFEEHKGLLQHWTAPLKERPGFAACAAQLNRPVAVLLATNHAGGSRISRLEVNLDGKVSSGERLIRQSENTVVAVAATLHPESGDEFLVLESKPQEPDHLALVTVTAGGDVRATKMQQMPDWPHDEKGNLAPPLQAQIEQATDGSVHLAFVDARGFLYGGKMGATLFLSTMRADAKSTSAFPHVAALFSATATACFTSDGMLFTAGPHAQE